MIFLFAYFGSGIIVGCIFLSWYIFTTKNNKENKQLRQDNKKLKKLLQEAVDKNNRLSCEKTELLKLINKLQESNKNTSSASSTYESIRDSLQAQNNSVLMDFASQLHLLAAASMINTPYGCLSNPYMPASNPPYPYPYTWH